MCSTETVPVDRNSPTNSPDGHVMDLDSGGPTKPLPLPPDTNNNHPPPRIPNRRSNKPIMEKRRRARINNCLNELKGILLEAMRKDPARHSKLEKADILELTVSHLKSLHERRPQTSTSEILTSRYRAGFSECAAEVGRFLTSSKGDGIDQSTTNRLLAHLNDCVDNNGLLVGSKSSSPCPTSTPIGHVTNGPSSDPHFGNGQLMSSATTSTPIISLLPSRLPSGEIAFVVPGFTSTLRNGFQIQAPPLPSTIAPPPTHQSYQPLLSPGDEGPLELTTTSNNHHLHLRNSSGSPSASSTSSLSPAYSVAPYAHQSHQNTSYYYYSQQPLALVTPKREIHNLGCWRPW